MQLDVSASGLTVFTLICKYNDALPRTQWLQVSANGSTCPVCKSAVNIDDVTPLYGRGAERADPRFGCAAILRNWILD